MPASWRCVVWPAPNWPLKSKGPGLKHNLTRARAEAEAEAEAEVEAGDPIFTGCHLCRPLWTCAC